jgi:hypothetical protein
MAKNLTDSVSPEEEVFFSLCKQIDTPVSLSLWLQFKYAPKELIDHELDIGSYLEKDLERFKAEYLLTNFLRKWKGFDVGIDLEAVALQKFTTSELECRQANRRLRAARSEGYPSFIASVMFTAQRKIALLLGPMSLFCVSPFFGWGPGATFDKSRRTAQVDKKISAVPVTVSGRALDLLRHVISDDLHWSAAILGVLPSGPFSFMPNCFLRTDSCRVTTVPKSAKTDRVIAIEPTGNLFLQKGVGGYFRERLKRRGVDLDDQQVNQRLAAQAGNLALATLDLRAASDSVSREIVYDLLPFEWASLLDSLRSPTALLPDGSTISLEKFSSMGNGFTFELESLLFWALGSSVTELLSEGRPFSVYGDDIICARECAPELIRVLDFCGFSINKDKSFVDGLFFESCGKHYFDQVDVTPAYQKEQTRDVSEAFRLHNRLVRWSQRVGITVKASDSVRRRIPPAYRNCLLPFGAEGDDGMLVPLDELNEVTLDPSLGFRVRVLKGATLVLPGIESALLALDLRLRSSRNAEVSSSLFPSSKSAKPTYGDIEVPVDLSPDLTLKSAHHRARDVKRLTSHRWVYPIGYCALPQYRE